MDPRYFDPLGLSSSFVHKRLFGAARGFLTGGPSGAVIGLISPGGGSSGRSGSRAVPRGTGEPVPGLPVQAFALPAPVDPCSARGMVIDRTGRCVARAGLSGLGPGPGLLDPLGLDLGARARELFAPPPVASTNGVAMIGASAVPPFRFTQTVRRCEGRNHVLGSDGLCYDKKSIRKDQRMWPPGRPPLLTGGQLNAIAIAAKAAGRIKTQTKRLQKLGMLQKPKSTRKAIAPVSHHHD